MPLPAAPAGDVPDAIDTGSQARLRPLREAVLRDIEARGPFEQAPSKSDVGRRRRTQFAMVGPTTEARIPIGRHAKGPAGHGLLKSLPPGGTCAHAVRPSSASEMEATLFGGVRATPDAAG
jgi:hypothetical protein